MKIGASVLLGDEDEEVEVYGELDCVDFSGGDPGLPVKKCLR